MQRNPSFTIPGDADDKGWVADLLAPELSYAPLVTKWVGTELFANWGGIFQYPEEAAPNPKKFDMGLHDIRVGGKLSVPIIPVLKLGFVGSYAFLNGRKERGWLDPNAIPMQDGLGWTALATIQLQDLAPSLPNLMVNYSENDLGKTYGAGVELAAEGFALFAETQSVQPNNSSGPFDTDSGYIRLTPGVAFGTGTSGLTFKAGYSFAFGRYPNTDEDAPNEFLLGLVIATPFGKRAPAQLGMIAGRVVDERTGTGLVAGVSFPESPRLAPLTSSSAGVFTLDRVPAGMREIRRHP